MAMPRFLPDPAGKAHRLSAVLIFTIAVCAFLLFQTPVLAQQQQTKPVEKISSDYQGPAYQEILSRPHADYDAWKADLDKAYELFMAEVRPALIRAGFGTMEELTNDSYYYNSWDSGSDLSDNTKHIAELLWQFHPFPEIQKHLYEGLLQDSLSTKLRLSRFANSAVDVGKCLKSLHEEKLDYYMRLSDLKWEMSYWHNGGFLKNFDSNSDKTPTSAEEKAIHKEKIALADKWLPVMLRAYDEDAPLAHLEEMERLNLKPFQPWGDARDGYETKPAWELRSDRRISFSPALLALWKARNNPAAEAQALGILEDQRLSYEKRWEVVNLASRYPGRDLSEYAAVTPHLSGISSMNGCWESMSWSNRWGVSFGGCEGSAFDSLRAEREAAPRIMLTMEQEAPAVILTAIASDEPLPVSRHKDGEYVSTSLGSSVFGKGPLYLVLESRDSGPKFFDLGKENSYPVFTRGVLYYMDDGPRLIPLNLSKESHKKLLQWYLEQGAVQGRSILLSSTKPVEKILKGLESWNLIVWEYDKDKPELVLTFADGGNVLYFLLSHAGPEAAEVLLEGMDKVWFKKLGKDKDIWYEARKAKAWPGVSGEGKDRPIVAMTYEVNDALGPAYTEEQQIREVMNLQLEYPETKLNRAEGLDFLTATREQLFELYEGLDDDSWHYDQSIEYLWSVHDLPVVGGQVRDILLKSGTKDELTERLREVETIMEGRGEDNDIKEDNGND